MLNKIQDYKRSKLLSAYLKPLSTGLLALSLLITVPISSARAEVFPVADLSDDGLDVTTDGICDPCTLREAIAEANASAGLDTITIPEGTINVFVNWLLITDDLIIEGQGRELSRINASFITDPTEGPAGDGFLDGFEPPFLLFATDSENINVTIRNLTLDGANEVSDYTYPVGGCFAMADAQLTIEGVNFQNCVATVQGGAIYALTAAVNITNSNFIGNAALVGGAIYLEESSATINKSSFGPNNFGQGSAIALANATAEVTNSTFTGNLFGALSVGALASLNLNHVTIANNGGAEAINNQGTLVVNNSILGPQSGAINTCVTGGGIVDLTGANNIEPSDSCGLIGGSNPLLLNDPLIGPFDNSSGLGVHQLLAGSPAIEGAIGSTLTEDQLGNPRDSTPDIGAIEFQAEGGDSSGGSSGSDSSGGSSGGGSSGDSGGGCSLALAGSASSGIAWMGLALLSLLGFRRVRK